MNPIIAITGSNGFIGKNLAEFFERNNYRIYRLQRSNSSKEGIINYNLKDPLNEKALQNVDYIIHTAVQHYGPKTKDSDKVNLKAALELISFAEKFNKKIIFLGTFSAHAHSRSHYGTNKLMLEKLFSEKGHLVLKLGLVVGNNGGLFNSISQTISKAKFIPLLGTGNQPIQTLYIEDLHLVILKCIKQQIKGVFHIAHPQCFTIRSMYEQIAHRLEKKINYLSVPFPLMYYPVKIAESIGIKLPVSSESVLGLKHLQCFETESDLRKLDITLLNFQQSLEKLVK